MCRLDGLELVSTEPAAGADFYAWLVGRSPEGTSSVWDTAARLHGCGIASVTGPETGGPGVGWIPAFAVADMPGATQRASGAGSIVKTIPTPAGARTYVVDGHGVWTRIVGPDTASVGGPAVGRNNVDYATVDTETAAGHYQEVLGLRRLDVVEDPYDFRLLHADRRIVAGFVRFGGYFLESGKSEWLVYFDVPDVDQAVARAVEAGAGIVVPANESTMNRYAVLRDPFGQLFGLSRYHPGAELPPVAVATGAETGLLTDYIDFD